MPFILAIASSILYGFADFLGGMGSRRAPVVTVTAWFQVTGLAFLVLYACFAPGVTRPSDLAWASAAGVSGGAGVLLLYRALAVGTVSTAAPMISMIALSVPVVVGIARGERPGGLALAGIGLGLVAVALISLHGVEGPPAPGAATQGTGRATSLALSVTSGVLIGLFLVCLGRVERGASGWALVAGRASAGVLLWGTVLVTRAPVRLAASARPPVLGAAITDVSANVLYVLAVQRAPLSLVATLVSLAPATTVLLAQLVLRERLAPAQRFGVGVALVAVVLLAQG
jgi:drug/metabolite transporter (DMT)-like permease